jgi:hypothetical protein
MKSQMLLSQAKVGATQPMTNQAAIEILSSCFQTCIFEMNAISADKVAYKVIVLLAHTRLLVYSRYSHSSHCL